ncbi:MAG: GatB/YqeY domain-containing protein, partial [Parcubacteria group bacterium]|nr:GatB/YqeY domain-containing protein [Parcubacteria group bacterium]
MSEAKKRREAIEGFEKGGRIDLVEKERKELGILETYLPLQLSDEEIQKEIDGAVKAVGASSTKDVGKVMAYLGARLKGKADMGLVSKKVASKLAAGT